MALAGVQMKSSLWHQLFEYDRVLGGYQVIVIAGHDQSGRGDIGQLVHGVMSQAGIELTQEGTGWLDMAHGNLHKLLNLLRLVGDKFIAEKDVHILLQDLLIRQPFIGQISVSRLLA